MQTTKAKQGQSFFDVVIESTGAITNTFEMALANNISITDEVFNQMELVVAGTEKKAITQLFLIQHPATKDHTVASYSDYVFPQLLPIIL